MSKRQTNPNWWNFPEDNPNYRRRFAIALRIAGWSFNELRPDCRAALKLLLENLLVPAEAKDREKALDLLLVDERNRRLVLALENVKSGPRKKGRPLNRLNRALALMLTIAYQTLADSDLSSRPARIGLEAGAKSVFQILRIDKIDDQRRELNYAGRWKSAVESAVKILKP
jgi:hypothetical protein